MATLTLSVPDELLRQAKARFGSNASAGIQEYLLSALQALTMQGQPIDADTRAKLMEGLNSPLEDMTDRDWQALRERAARRDKP